MENKGVTTTGNIDVETVLSDYYYFMSINWTT